MSLAWENQLMIITTGKLNTVNDTVIGGSSGVSGTSKYAGMLGKTVTFTSEQIGAVTKASVGTLYAGRYRYVRMRDADDDSPAITPGKLVFWDTTIANWDQMFQVTRDENLSSSANAVMIAGVYIGGITGGNYGFIQDMGRATLRFRNALTAAGAIGSSVYATAAGDTGDDQGTADVLTTDSTSVANTRHLGVAITAPAASSLSTILLNFFNALAMS